jgi:HEAT repeat protein
MCRLVRAFVLVALVSAPCLAAVPKDDPAAALKACWARDDGPVACEPLARELTARPRTDRLRLMGGLIAGDDAASRTLALWLALQTRTAFDDPAVVERLLSVQDARVLSLALDYLLTFKTVVHASLINDLALKSTIPNVRGAAIRLLPDLDPGLARAAAREGLQASSAAVQAAAAGVAGRLKDLESVDVLVSLLSNPRYPIAVRLEVVDALRRIGDPSVAPLLHLHLRWPEAVLGHKLVTAFGETAPAQLAPFLTDELLGEYNREVMVALARLKNPETTQALIGLFERPDARAQALHLLFWTLSEMKDPAAVPSLLVQLRSADTDRARRAAEALGGIGSRTAVRPLVEQLSNPDTGVADMVAWALEKITGQTFEKDRTAWESWLEQNPY